MFYYADYVQPEYDDEFNGTKIWYEFKMKRSLRRENQNYFTV